MIVLISIFDTIVNLYKPRIPGQLYQICIKITIFNISRRDKNKERAKSQRLSSFFVLPWKVPGLNCSPVRKPARCRSLPATTARPADMCSNHTYCLYSATTAKPHQSCICIVSTPGQALWNNSGGRECDIADRLTDSGAAPASRSGSFLVFFAGHWRKFINFVKL